MESKRRVTHVIIECQFSSLLDDGLLHRKRTRITSITMIAMKPTEMAMAMAVVFAELGSTCRSQEGKARVCIWLYECGSFCACYICLYDLLRRISLNRGFNLAQKNFIWKFASLKSFVHHKSTSYNLMS